MLTYHGERYEESPCDRPLLGEFPLLKGLAVEVCIGLLTQGVGVCIILYIAVKIQNEYKGALLLTCIVIGCFKFKTPSRSSNLSDARVQVNSTST